MAIALEKDYAPPVVDQEQQETRPGLPFSFTGKASEYFGIWIVNIILSVITLGIYSAWAKVRNKRYFYGNTKLNGSSFSYLASPPPDPERTDYRVHFPRGLCHLLDLLSLCRRRDPPVSLSDHAMDHD